ncbi:MAG: HYR domain-containing protein [Solirubrobacteraceae bacterium]
MSATSATFSFSSTDGTATFECKLDGGAFAACTSPDTINALADGSHTFSVRARDPAGNIDATPPTRTWTVDTTAPATTLSGGPALGSTVTATSATFSFSSTDGTATFECKLDGGSFAACTSPDTINALADGSHTFSVRARDPAGNIDATPPSRTWTVDTVPPTLVVPANGVTAEANGPTGSKVNFTVTGSDGTSALLPTQITCVPPSASLFPLGKTTVTCTTTPDVAGNIGTASFTVTVVDTSPPQLAVPGDFGVYATSDGGIASSDSAVANVLGAAKAVDLVDPHPVVTNNAPAVLPHGTTTVTFTAKDATGNTATKVTHITVTDRPPSGGSGPAPAPVVDTTAPANPGSFLAKVAPGMITLTWKLPSDSDFDHVEIFRSAQQAPRTTAAPTDTRVYSGTGTSFVDKGLTAGTEYRYLIASFDKTGNRSAGAVIVAVAKAAMLLAPADSARVSRVPTLQWKAVTGAAYYNVQLYRGKSKVLSAWPTGTSLALHLSWKYNGTKYTLAPGLYHWFVWPGVGARAAGRYGAPLGDRTFTVLKGVKP